MHNNITNMADKLTPREKELLCVGEDILYFIIANFTSENDKRVIGYQNLSAGKNTKITMKEVKMAIGRLEERLSKQQNVRKTN